jgi:hypothetical protein
MFLEWAPLARLENAIFINGFDRDGHEKALRKLRAKDKPTISERTVSGNLRESGQTRAAVGVP